jgi:hypothetical protein
MRRLSTVLAVLTLLAAVPARASELERVGAYPTDAGATEIEVAGNLAFLVSQSGLDIVSIADPAHPRRLSLLECTGSFDVALDPAAQIAVVAIDGASGCMTGEGFLVVDIRDPANPEIVSTVGMPEGAHTVTMDGRILFANQQDETLQARRLEIFDLSDPHKPRAVSTVEFAGNGPHDSSVRRRPDGRTLLYTANVTASSVLDIGDLAAPRILQTVRDPAINYAHQAEISHDDQVILVSDEMLIGNPSGVCGKAPAGADVGALHFYAAAADGTFATEGQERLGSWNVPVQASGAETCTIHVFVQAPHDRRVLAAWYQQGVRVADFADPAAVRELASFAPAGSLARQAIPHNGLIFTADINRGMDVLRYTGSGWPATAGPAEAYRFGKPPAAVAPSLPPAGAAPAPGSASASASAPAGRARFRLRLRRAGRLAITDARGVQVAAVRVPRRALVSVTGLPGRYRWTARSGRRRLGGGRFTISRARPGLSLPSGQVVRLRLSR